MRDGVGHLVERRVAQVVDGVAGLVVARVVGDAGGAAVDRRLLSGLDALGAGEQATGGDAVVDEGEVVGASVELGRLGRQPLRGEVVEEHLLDSRRAVGPGGAEGRAVTVVHEADEVRRADHVEVEVHGVLLERPGVSWET